MSIAHQVLEFLADPSPAPGNGVTVPVPGAPSEEGATNAVLNNGKLIAVAIVAIAVIVAIGAVGSAVIGILERFRFVIGGAVLLFGIALVMMAVK